MCSQGFLVYNNYKLIRMENFFAMKISGNNFWQQFLATISGNKFIKDHACPLNNPEELFHPTTASIILG